MAVSQARATSNALKRLRLGVSAYCWVVGVALLIEITVWSLSTYTDLRYETISVPAAADAAPLVVTADSPSVASTVVRNEATAGATLPPDPNRVLGRYDRAFAMAVGLARGLGALGMLGLVILVGVGVVLSASAGTRGIEKTVSAFMWSLVLAALVLPLGLFMTLPWHEGALNSYKVMIASVEALETSAIQISSAAFFSRFFLMPLTCLVGTALVGLRFSAGTEASVMEREAVIDPDLEEEASNIKATSLQSSGARAADALKTVTAQNRSGSDDVELPTPSATAVSPGSPQRRPI